MTDDQQLFAAFVTGDPGTATVASARQSLGIDEPNNVRAELDSLRAGRDRLTKENAALRQQANVTATQLAEAKRATADAAANAATLRSANDEQGRQISQLRKELDAARASAAAPAAAPAAQAATATPAPTAKVAAPSGPSAYWNGKEWPSDDELRHMMWKYYDTNKVDLEQPLAYKEAEKELRRRTGAK
jgi:multidrug efflux pump subunit AcrA (membrane-fusion protein)